MYQEVKFCTSVFFHDLTEKSFLPSQRLYQIFAFGFFIFLHYYFQLESSLTSQDDSADDYVFYISANYDIKHLVEYVREFERSLYSSTEVADFNVDNAGSNPSTYSSFTNIS